MTRKIIALSLLLPFLATGAVLAGQPAAQSQAAPSMCDAPLFASAPILQVEVGEVVEVGGTTPEAVEMAEEACTVCEIRTPKCDATYCYIGDNCCCPTGGAICPCVCW